MALDLVELTAGLPPFGLVAHSYGCLVAARFAAARPERVRGLALVEPPFGLALDDVDPDAVESAGRALPRRQRDRPDPPSPGRRCSTTYAPSPS